MVSHCRTRLASLNRHTRSASVTYQKGRIGSPKSKLDGYRCLAGKDASGASLGSRRGNAFALQFPTIAKACDDLPTGTLVDGEIVAVDSEGQISFNPDHAVDSYRGQALRSEANGPLPLSTLWAMVRPASSAVNRELPAVDEI